MLLVKQSVTAVLGMALVIISAAYAGNSPEEIRLRIGNGDPVAGKEKSALCQECHGKDGNSSSPIIPKLAGQYSDYIQRQIYNYQTGSRSDPVMTGIAVTLNNQQDLSDIGAYFASQTQMVGMPVENEAGEKIFREKGCLNCHGENGKGKPSYNVIFPIIGGQHRGYLIKQMKNFKSGDRNTDISGMMGLLTNQMSYDDIVSVSEYISGL
jgi:cytochrome c553